ncbi:prefoldin subunit 2 [Aethina tumida]|uniref:prefoldin subunit 2 n=1 Tax=Aethina tumida TaxID=116153 RepID=UPI002147283A|nr:prefoldin subunit 2 [Aethina tumida]
MASNSKKPDPKAKTLSPDEILSGFQAMRAEQRTLTTKLSEFEYDLNEHKMVIETLKNVNDDRKCFRLVGGVLTERKVKDVLPVLISNQENLAELIEKLNEQITKKGQEINEYREKHNIRFRGLDTPKTEESVTESRGKVLVS